MSYFVIYLDDIAELKTRRGNSNVDVLGTILGVDYPNDEDFIVYRWYDSSTATPDDYEIVASVIGDPNVGRWMRINNAQLPQVNSDWNSTDGPSKILNKPTLFSGSYTDLTNKPTIPAAQVQTDWNAVSGISVIANRPSLVAVATSGNYNDLNNKPTIQAIQRTRVQTDSSGVYTWTFPNDYGGSVIPVVSVAVEDNTSGAIWSSKITAVNHSSVSVQLSKTVPTTILGISVLGTVSSPQAYIHLTAVAP